MNYQSLMLTFLAGLFFVIGYFVTLFFKKRKKLIDFALGMAFSILSILAVFEINAEAMENFNFYYSNSVISLLLLIGSISIGMGLLKLLDKLVPHHDHFEEKKTHDNHLQHIGVMLALSLIVHNLIEGMSIYTLSLTDLKNGLILALAIGLHHLPFGMQIGLFTEKQRKKSFLLLFILAISPILGGLIIGLIGQINILLLGILLGINLGMIVYILVFELFTEIKECENKKNVYLGMLIGLVIMAISFII